MLEFLNYLAIGVTPSGGATAEELARQAREAQSKTVWLIVLIILLIAEIAISIYLPKLIAKHKAKKQEEAEVKARRKAIQSKRK